MTMRLVGVASLVLVIGLNFLPGSDPSGQLPTPPTGNMGEPAKPGPQAWTLEEALQQLEKNPRDPYLTYVVLQLARRADKLDEVTKKLNLRSPGEENRNVRAQQMNVFNIFSGALAVQESLQLDAMLGELVDVHAPMNDKQVKALRELIYPNVAAEQSKREKALADDIRKFQGYGLFTSTSAAGYPSGVPWLEAISAASVDEIDTSLFGGLGSVTEETLETELQQKHAQQIPIDKLSGPTQKSHPWHKMLAGRQPKVSALSQCVPHDFYLAEFRSVGKLLESVQTQELWTRYLFNQAFHDATDPQLVQRYLAQLALPLGLDMRQLYQQSVQELAICGSDLFFAEGTDLTVVIRFQGDELKSKLESHIDAAAKKVNARRSAGKFLGVSFTHAATPDRALSVYSAYPQKGLHVRSNSEVGMRRVLAAIQGKDDKGSKVMRLGDTDEFKYMRTLMKMGDKEEDGFLYLSDPFMRHMVGPRLKLVQRRRALAFNHLTMIGHAAHLYLTERGQTAATLDALTTADCAPGAFNDTPLACPFGGKYTLAADGLTGISTVSGAPSFLTPCCEFELNSVNGVEAELYKQFLDDYNKYWTKVFDPIAVRVQVTPKQYRLETIVLPLIENTIYAEMAKLFGGNPEPLDALPVPKRNLFSMNFRLNKDYLLKLGADDVPDEECAKKTLELLTKGLGNQCGLHVYDTEINFAHDLPGALAQELNNPTGGMSLAIPGLGVVSPLGMAPLAVGAFAPTYIAMPVKDSKVVDDFLDYLDKKLASLPRKPWTTGSAAEGFDFYKVKTKGGLPIRCFNIKIGPAKLRVFWGRVDDGLYIANQPYIFDDLQAAAAHHPLAAGPSAHAMLKLRPKHWQQALAGFQLGWAESDRIACLHNHGPLASTARAVAAKAKLQPGQSWDKRDVLKQAYQLYGLHFSCPGGGDYEFSADGKKCQCTLHGSTADPRQELMPAKESPLAKLMDQFADLTAALTFEEDGLRAVLVIEKK